MSLGLTAEQQDLAEATSALLQEYATGAFARAAMVEPERWRELWKALHEMGIPAMLAPDSDGGLGLGLPELVGVMECAGQVLLPAPLLSSAGAFTPAVMAAGGSSMLVEELVSGAVGALVLDEGFGGTGNHIALNDDGMLSVDCPVVPDAPRADFIAFALSGEQPCLAVVRAEDLDIDSLPAVDETQPVAKVKGSAVHPLLVLGDPTVGVRSAFIAAAAELVGMAAALEKVTIEHARAREQFGVPIGSFQAVKHALANVHVDVESARSLVYRAAAAPNDPAAVHQAKAAASDAALHAARTAVQVHGGMGITREHDVSLMYLRARQSSMVLGTSDFHWNRAADALLD